MSEWANKPDAVMHAEVITTEAELDELHHFFENNPMPRWLLHPDSPPYPSRSELSFYLERGNPIIVARDQDGELWGYRVGSRKDGYALWIMVRREAPEVHDLLPDGSHGMSPNSRQSTAHMNALAWKLWGEGVRKIRGLPDDDFEIENPNLAQVDMLELQTLTEQVYHEHYESMP